MNKFNEREKSFENKFAKDQELQFKVAARSNKYLGEWAGHKLEKTDEEKQNGSIPILNKPYHRAALLNRVAQMLTYKT